MHVSPAKHSYASVTDGQTDRRTDGRTDGRTDDGQSDPYVSLCVAGDTQMYLSMEKNLDFKQPPHCGLSAPMYRIIKF